jgi:glutathione synthase
VTVQRIDGDHFQRGDYRLVDLARDIDVVLMRQDPPFDLGYITGTHLLERLKGTTLVVNDPAAVRNAPEKVLVLDYARFMPPTLVARRIEDVKAFQQRQISNGLGGDIVVKPLHGNGGKAVFRVPADGSNLGALVEMFGQVWPEPFMVQAFIPEVSEGDKRIVLVDGEVAGAINRKPGEGEFRSNLAVGGYAEATTLTEREEEICAAMGPELKARGLLFVGIDVIGGKWLTEINVTSPTGIVAIDKFNGTDTGGLIWDAIEARHAAMLGA